MFGDLAQTHKIQVHYEAMNDEAQTRIDAIANILYMGTWGQPNKTDALNDLYHSLLALGVSRAELDTARCRSGV
jgi:hypothetical protein